MQVSTHHLNARATTPTTANISSKLNRFKNLINIPTTTNLNPATFSSTKSNQNTKLSTTTTTPSSNITALLIHTANNNNSSYIVRKQRGYQHVQSSKLLPRLASSSPSSSSRRFSKMDHEKPTKRQRKDIDRDDVKRISYNSDNNNDYHHRSAMHGSRRPKNYVAYFDGHQIIRYSNNLILDFDRFTISLWMYVEGGEYKNASILRIYNHCSFLDLSSLEIGVTTLKDETLLYFSLRTSQSNITTKLMSDTPIRFQRWTHVTVSYDGSEMVLYVDRAKIAVVHQQTGLFLSNAYPHCTTLDVGGNADRHDYFRGAVDKIAIVNDAVSHRLISQKFFRRLKKLFVLKEDFSRTQDPTNSLLMYHAVHHTHMPTLMEDRIHRNRDEQKMKLDIPKCGKTLCDNPEVIQNYLFNPDIYMFRKEVRYRVVLITKDDGSICKLSENDIHRKHKTLSKVFRKQNIFLYLDIAKFTKTSLCNKTVLISCYRPCPDESAECAQAISMDKIGCRRTCDSAKLGNGHCDIECNNPDRGNNWDRGDCCNSSITNTSETCYDPRSTNRGFIMESELKTYLNLTNSEAIVILPVRLPDNFLGKSTYPWTSNVYSAHGGITMNYKEFLPSSSSSTSSDIVEESKNDDVVDIIHELGHAFGLWHVHRGVSEVGNTTKI